MYYWIYNSVLHLALPVMVGLLLVKKRLQRGLKPRFGFLDSSLQHLPQPVIWLHAVSLGEVLAAIPLLRGLKDTWPKGTLVVSTVTETGKEVVATQLEGIARHCYAPLDFSWAVSRYIRGLNPSLFILMESEFWPNLLRRLHRHHVPICLVNGRISSRSFSRYQFIQPLMRQVLACMDLALVQSERDGQRMVALGAPGSIVQVTGNMKFDQMSHQTAQASKSLISRQDLGLEMKEILFVAGSTHEREEGDLVKVYQEVVRDFPQLVLLLAPRHIERTEQVERRLRGSGLACVRRSQLAVEDVGASSPQRPRVIILDTRGELAGCYRLGVAGFVGGTLVPVGGHNLLEPAQWGKPVLFGPFTDHCQESADLLLAEGGGIQVLDCQALSAQLTRLLADPERTSQIGHRAAAAVQQRRGAVSVNLQKIRELVSQQKVLRESPPAETGIVSATSQSMSQ